MRFHESCHDNVPVCNRVDALNQENTCTQEGIWRHFRVAASRADILTSWNLCRFCATNFFCNLLRACCRPDESPTITGCVLLHSIGHSRSNHLSVEHQPRIAPHDAAICALTRKRTSRLWYEWSHDHRTNQDRYPPRTFCMISVNNDRQHVEGEGKQKTARVARIRALASAVNEQNDTNL